jgi:hypothetical protein
MPKNVNFSSRGIKMLQNGDGEERKKSKINEKGREIARDLPRGRKKDR